MKALIMVDIQNDFLPRGALAVPDGEQVIPVANRAQEQFELVVATQDWHPADHGSFAASHPGQRAGDVIELAGLSQVLWPVHCVQGSPGARFSPDLDMSGVRRVFRKGSDPKLDSYSGFFDNGRRRSTGLGEFLREQRVRQVYLLGLATDYCVKFSALDARDLGFETFLITEGCRGVELEPGDVQRALGEMEAAGVRLLTGPVNARGSC